MLGLFGKKKSGSLVKIVSACAEIMPGDRVSWNNCQGLGWLGRVWGGCLQVNPRGRQSRAALEAAGVGIEPGMCSLQLTFACHFFLLRRIPCTPWLFPNLIQANPKTPKWFSMTKTLQFSIFRHVSCLGMSASHSD